MSVHEVSFEEELNDIEEFLLRSAEVGGVAGVTEIVETLNPFHDTNLAAAPRLEPPETLAQLVANPEAHPLVLNVLMLKTYGPEYLLWSMPAVERGLEAFGDAHDVNVAKLMAAQLCHTTDGPWKRWEQFTVVASAFTDILPDFEVMQVLDPIQISIAVGIMNTLEDRPDWSEEVRLYIATSYSYHQVMLPTPPITFVSVDANWAPHDRALILRAFPEVLRTGVVSHGGIEGEQLRRMLIIEQAKQIFKNRLRQQLPLVQR